MSSLITQVQGAISSLIPNENKALVKRFTKVADQVFAYKSNLEHLTGEELTAKSLALKARVSDEVAPLAMLPREERTRKEKVILDAVMVEAFALVREASRRVLKMEHFRVQIVGGALMHSGHIAEMRTGEGKTLTATLAVYLNALTGLGVHVVTVNDYLSRRDAVWMGKVYHALGLTTAVINHQSAFMFDESATHDDVADDAYRVNHQLLRPIKRKEAYQADITYGTNNEFGFDYLRDNIGYSVNEIVQTRHHFAIVDEIDSILIDEARTPLIISAPQADAGDLYTQCADIADKLHEGDDYTIDEKQRAITMTDAGITRAEQLLGVENIYSDLGMKFVHHIETAVKAKALFIREKEYVVKDGEVIIVDEFTGRLQPGRRWSDGIHQAVEAKEGVKIERESRTLASITFQNFFRFYDKLAGMTGTAETSAEEFYKVYGLVASPVPTHHPTKRADHPDNIFQSEKGKWQALAKKVKELHEKGQPVLIGTISIEKNEVVSKYLTHAGVPHTVLNAKNHEREGEIIASAGKRCAVTIATNMAGRGVDIKLGGPEATESEREEILSLGGLYVIGTERHEARRIDNQLRGRAGRQGDAGETQFYVSLEDDLMRIFGSEKIKTMMGRFGIPEDEPLSSGIVSRALESAQEKIEGFHFDSRKHTLQYDDVLTKQRNSIYDKRRRILTKDVTVLDEFFATLPPYHPTILETVEERRNRHGESTFNDAVSITLLQLIDMLWVDHLDHMESLRSSVNLRAYGQRDPLVEYKKEALRMYKTLNDTLANNMCMFIENIDHVFVGAQEVPAVAASEGLVVPAEMQVIEESAASHDAPSTIVRDAPKVSRNDPCPCGSGKKVKKCTCTDYAHLRA